MIYCVGEARVVNVITFSPPTQYHSLAITINPHWLIDNASIIMCGTICEGIVEVVSKVVFY